jgi:hypothetical protein
MELPNRADWYVFDHGLPHPDWIAVNGWRRAYVARADENEFWHRFVRQWLETLGRALPGHYQQCESEGFHLLCELDQQGGTRLLEFLERCRHHIQKIVGDTADQEWHGKHLVLRLSDEETYYRYLTHYYPDGEHGASAGCFLKSHYCHIVYPASWSMEDERATLAHEMTHNLLADLPVPRWLDEALAMAFQADISGLDRESISKDLIRRHREYWDTCTIQEFWTGSSFGTPTGQELSYGLARVLLDLIYHDLRPEPANFRRFVLAADWHDGGLRACREHLEVELGELAGGFLGAGDWGPKPSEWERHDLKNGEVGEKEEVGAEEEAPNDRHGSTCDACGAPAHAIGKLLGKVIYRCAAGHEFVRGRT